MTGSDRLGLRGALALAASCAAGLLAPAGASALACGAAVDHDVKLHTDLDCSAFAGDALEIADDHVTVDLNGHKLIGPDDTYAGIDGNGEFDDLTVKDGTIKGFGYSIVLTRNRGVTLSHLKIKLEENNEHYGVYGGELPHLHASHLVIDNALYAFYIYSSKKDTRLSHSRVTGSDPGDTYAVYIGTASDSNYTGVVDDVQANGALYGFYLYGPSTGFKLTDSVANNGGDGFYISNAQDQREYTLSDNTANGNVGYGFYAARNTAGSGNTATGNGTDCVKVHCS